MKKMLSDGLTYGDKVRLVKLCIFLCVIQFVLIMLKCFGLISMTWPWVLFLMWGIPLGLVIIGVLTFIMVMLFILFDYWRWHHLK